MILPFNPERRLSPSGPRLPPEGGAQGEVANLLIPQVGPFVSGFQDFTVISDGGIGMKLDGPPRFELDKTGLYLVTWGARFTAPVGMTAIISYQPNATNGSLGGSEITTAVVISVCGNVVLPDLSDIHREIAFSLFSAAPPPGLGVVEGTVFIQRVGDAP